MVFSSILFLFVYLPVVLAVYYIVPARYRNLWLFIVNLVFYGWGEPVYILLMVFSIALNYAAGLLIARYRLTDDKKARAVLTVNTVVNLALLIFFKYFDLLAATLSRIPGINIPALGLTLPIGISFYTFQTMSYPIDVYRGDTEEQKNFIRFGTFVALFPQLIAGPIVRYKDVASQLGTRRLSSEQFSSGVQRFAIGLGKKVLLANNIGALWDIYAAAPPFLSSSTLIFPATRTWPSVSGGCSALSFWKTSIIRTSRRASRNSGGAGICRSAHGSVITSISLSAATAAACPGRY